MREECGIIAAFNVPGAQNIAYYGLTALQHRGQEAAGLAAVLPNGLIHVHKGFGLAHNVIRAEHLQACESDRVLGHVRYARSSENTAVNIQPIVIRSHAGDFAIAHNGSVTNSRELKIELEAAGSIFHSTGDSELLAHLIQRATGSFYDRVVAALPQLDGAFAYAILTPNALYAIRDHNGIRPLSLGKLNGAYLISSESCAFDIIGAEFVRDIAPGEILRISDNGGLESRFYVDEDKCRDRLCAMEYVYFSRPDSDLRGLNVHTARKRTGFALAANDRAELADGSLLADIVVGVPDSSLSAAQGYAEAAGLPYEMGLIKNKYYGRTFIQPVQSEREKGVKIKLSAVRSVVRDRHILLVDDSIVRGTTSRRIVNLLREVGAASVHLRIGSPQIISPCFYGVDMSTRDELVSVTMDLESLRLYTGADSLKFLPLEQMSDIFGQNLCSACFDRNYPTELYSLSKEI